MTLNIDKISDINTYGLDVENRELYLHSYIGGHDADGEHGPEIDYRMAAAFYKNIRILDTISKKPIVIHMHSYGGCYYDGMVIYDAITLCQSYVTIIVYGQAESMSSVILQAADNRVMMPNAYYMCHYGSTGYIGNYLDVQKAAAFEKREMEVMLDIYCEVAMNGKYFQEQYADLTHEKIKNYLKRKWKDGDWYLDAEEAVNYGFADAILTSKQFPTIDSLKH